MASRRVLVNLCVIWFLLQDQSIFTDSSITVYTIEGSTINLTIEDIGLEIRYRRKLIYSNIDSRRVKTPKHDVVLRPISLIINVTANDTGFYWLEDYVLITEERLYTTSSSCPVNWDFGCAVEGSSTILPFISKWPVHYITNEVNSSRRSKSRIVSSCTIHADLYIYNVTHEDDGYYECFFVHKRSQMKLEVAKLRFINQTDINTIVGQEGSELEINCSSDTVQYITALKIESNGSIKAIGDNQTVSYSFIPDRTDHLSKYKCVDTTHLSIMIEVSLIIMYAPEVTIRYSNETIECDFDGNPGYPAIYSVYRLDKISKNGELVRSINLDNGTFTFQTDSFPYMRNGRYTCVVGNGIQDTNGDMLQTRSTSVKHEGPPVFAKENKYVKIGKVRQSSITMSFHVYSCPDVEEIFLEKIGRMRGKKRKIDKYVLKSTLLYNDFDNKNGIPGYDILIESEELGIDDFQAYCITIKNRFGASEYNFGIIKKDRGINQSERKYVFTICILGAVLFGSIIIHVGLCVKLVRSRVPIHTNVHGNDRNYHTYDEIGTILYGAVSNICSSNTNDNQGQNLTLQHAAHISNEANVQSTDNHSTDFNADLPNDDLPQHEVFDVQGQHMSISTNDTNIILDKKQLSDQKSQTSSDSESESSQSVMVGNVGDGYENPYQTVLQERPESHQYTKITRERNNSISSTESNCKNANI